MEKESFFRETNGAKLIYDGVKALKDILEEMKEVGGGVVFVDEAYQLIKSLKDPDINIDIDQVMEELLVDGIDKFVKPFESLMSSLEDKVSNLSPV